MPRARVKPAIVDLRTDCATVRIPNNTPGAAVRKLPTIGYSGSNTRWLDSQRLAAFVQRLSELGWIEDRTITIEYRWA